MTSVRTCSASGCAHGDSLCVRCLPAELNPDIMTIDNLDVSVALSLCCLFSSCCFRAAQRCFTASITSITHTTRSEPLRCASLAHISGIALLSSLAMTCCVLQLRTIFAKIENPQKGKYFAEISQEVFDSLKVCMRLRSYRESMPCSTETRQ